MRKWHIYECPVHKAPSLNREGGVGLLLWGCLLTLHLTPLSSSVLHHTVKFFYLLQLFNNTISMHPEMYHHSQHERWAPLDVIHIVPTFQGIKYLSPSPMNGWQYLTPKICMILCFYLLLQTVIDTYKSEKQLEIMRIESKNLSVILSRDSKTKKWNWALST